MKAVVMWFENVGWQHVVMGEPGRKYIPVVRIDGIVKVSKVDLRRPPANYPATRRGRPYPVERAIRKLVKIGREIGMTDSAKEVLGGAA